LETELAGVQYVGVNGEVDTQCQSKFCFSSVADSLPNICWIVAKKPLRVLCYVGNLSRK